MKYKEIEIIKPKDSLGGFELFYEELDKRKPAPKKTWLDKQSKKQVETWGIMISNVILLGFYMVARWAI